MAYFAKLDENNVVLEVHAVANEALDPNDEETSGIAFLTELLGYNNWKQTSYNATPEKRFNYAGIGYTYDPEVDAFVSVKPNCHAELILNTTNYRWECSNAEHDPQI
jgi:hypothetical protein